MTTDRFVTTIVLPWPPKELNPNFKRANHWTKYRPHEKQYRHDCFWETERQLDRKIDGSNKVIIDVEFYPPDNRGRDDDNVISQFKNGRDGMADAMNINDNMFKPSYSFMEPVKGGKIVVRL